MTDQSTEEMAKRMQRESVANYRYLYFQDRDGTWWFNRDGTVLTPVWVRASSYETSLLESTS